MNILLVNKFLYPRGGAESYVLKLGKYFESQGHNVSYFGMYDEKNIVGNKLDIYTSNLDFHSTDIRRFFYPFKIVYSWEAYRKFNQLLDFFHPDIIHLNNINFQITPSIIDAAWKRGIPILQTVHDSQMICPGHLLYNRKKGEVCEKCVYGSKWNCVKAKCIHGSFFKSLIGTIEGIFYDKKNTYDKVKLYICPSRFIESILLTRKRYAGKTKVLCNFIESFEEKKYTKKDYILYFGRLSEEKGIHMFLELCKKFPNKKFKIAGQGPLEEKCKQISNAQYLGLLTGDKLNRTIAEAELVVYPSICYENCPLSVLEAISLGTPVLASGRGGIRELIDNGKSGILVDEPFTMDNLLKEAEKLVNNKVLRKEMSQYCVRVKKDFLVLEQYGKELEKIYRSFL